MRRFASFASLVALSACGGAAFSQASGDGGAGDASSDGAIAIGDASTDGASSTDASADSGRPDASCTRTCPSGFACEGSLCIDGAALHFSPHANPGGNWTYGWSAMLGAPFTPFVIDFTHENTLAVWGVSSGSLTPSVFFNTNATSTVYDGTFTMEGHTLGLYPGTANEHAIVRFTAPATGRYGIDALFTGLSGANNSPLTTVSVTIFVNGSVVAGKTINTNGGANTAAYASQHNQLSAGEVIDFVVDYGNDHDAMEDPTGLVAAITAE